jgi:hypothetical protein
LVRSLLVCRIRKTWLEGAQVGVVGPKVDLTYPYEHLGEGAEALAQLNKAGKLAERLANANHPAVLVGPGILKRADRNAVLQQARPTLTSRSL